MLVAKKKSKRKPKLREETFSVVGIRHRLTAEARRALAKETSFVVALKREKLNPVDANAIAVHVIDPRLTRQQIGYMTRQAASVLAPALDAGSLEIESAVVTYVDPDEGNGEMVLSFRML